MKYRLLVIWLLLILGCERQSKFLVSKQSLHEGWQLKKTKDSIWYPAKVPGTIHSDLYENGLISHPFIKDNELKLQWISDSIWEYETQFLVDEKRLGKTNHVLNFEGLDTYASVYLNDSLILEANNAFRHWKVDVKPFLKLENHLKIVFVPTTIFERAEQEKLNYQLPEGPRVFTRKAQFQYGWDWGPKLNTSGIWRDVYIESWSIVKLQDVYLKQLSLSDELAQLELESTINLESETKLKLEILVSGNSVNTTEFELKKGEHLLKLPFEIANPKRWWPHNLGEPYLYDFEIRLKQKNKLLDVKYLKKGLRTIEHIVSKDSIGESFYFKVNGVPVFMKGANYIPQHSFQSEVTEQHYEQLLNDVAAANMNMLRVWGGGIYENDVFYQKCDEKGILVWQDFMFVCAMYPGDDAFLENVQHEAIDNLKRLRNYSSIALWCGNNENSEGWQRWGWQDGRTEAEKVEIWNNYLKVFDSILPNTVLELTETPYWQTSPKFGRGDVRYKTEGDAHDWWIWHDGHPFEDFEKNVPRFMSEFGFQSFPSYETIQFINSSDSIDIESPAFKNHQKHRIGFERIAEYMERDFPIPNKAEDYVYMSQLLQAYGVGKGIEAHRRARPYNMGSLYWQLNDCWPAVSWSSIDFFGNWKALHYQAKHSFENVLISIEQNNNNIKVFVINDKLAPQNGILELQLIDFQGQIIWQENRVINVPASDSHIYAIIQNERIKENKSQVVLKANFNEASSLFYFVKPKDIDLPEATLNMSVSKANDGFMIDLTSEVLQKNVYLFSSEKGQFSDNYFDLLPGTVKSVFFKTKATDAHIQFKTFNTFIR